LLEREKFNLDILWRIFELELVTLFFFVVDSIKSRILIAVLNIRYTYTFPITVTLISSLIFHDVR